MMARVKKKKKKKKKKNKGKRKLADAVDANTLDFTVPSSESLVPKTGYVDQHVIYYNQQNDWSRMGLNLNICKSLLRSTLTLNRHTESMLTKGNPRPPRYFSCSKNGVW